MISARGQLGPGRRNPARGGPPGRHDNHLDSKLTRAPVPEGESKNTAGRPALAAACARVTACVRHDENEIPQNSILFHGVGWLVALFGYWSEVLWHARIERVSKGREHRSRARDSIASLARGDPSDVPLADLVLHYVNAVVTGDERGVTRAALGKFPTGCRQPWLMPGEHRPELPGNSGASRVTAAGARSAAAMTESSRCVPDKDQAPGPACGN